MSDAEAVSRLAAGIVEKYAAASLTIATAESCTGGMVAAALTDVAGSSAVFDSGFVTYSNGAKMAMLGVAEATLAQHGAVSEAVAREMAEGARRRSGVDVATSITGIAGPGGGSDIKPVGLVHFACAGPAATIHREERFGERGRAAIRLASTRVALEMLRAALPGQVDAAAPSAGGP